MARTIRSVILATLNSRAYQDEEITARDLFWYAQHEKEYTGTEERLLSRAEDLVRQGVIGSELRGEETWYTRFAQSPRKCKPKSRTSRRSRDRDSGEEPYFGGGPGISSMAPVDGNALEAGFD